MTDSTNTIEAAVVFLVAIVVTRVLEHTVSRYTDHGDVTYRVTDADSTEGILVQDRDMVDLEEMS